MLYSINKRSFACLQTLLLPFYLQKVDADISLRKGGKQIVCCRGQVAHFATLDTTGTSSYATTPRRVSQDLCLTYILERSGGQGMTDRRSFNRRSRSAIAISSKDCRTIAIAKFNDRDRKNTIAIFLAFFCNQPFAGQIFHKCQSLKNEKKF